MNIAVSWDAECNIGTLSCLETTHRKVMNQSCIKQWIYSANNIEVTGPSFYVMDIVIVAAGEYNSTQPQVLGPHYSTVTCAVWTDCSSSARPPNPSHYWDFAGDETTNDQWRRASAVEPTVPSESRQKNSRRANSVERAAPAWQNIVKEMGDKRR